MPRVLYIDTPFELETGGDKTRSRFLWNTLRASYDTDLLLVHPHSSVPRSSPAFSLFTPILELDALPPSWTHSHSVHRFTSRQFRDFDRLLSHKLYDAVVCRFHSPWLLACAADAHPSHPAIVVDLDRVPSSVVGLTWRQAPSLRNRWFLFERLKLERLERRLLRRPWLVLLSNLVERDQLSLDFAHPGSRVRLDVLPNILVPGSVLPTYEPRPVILFFGDLDSAANTDAFRFLVQDILPLIDADLRRHNVEIHVAGRNPPAWFQTMIQESGSDRIVILDRVDSMELAIAESRFVLLPLRFASGTRTRILEVAAQFRAVVTTPKGAEGISVGTDALIASDAAGLAAGIRRLLEAPDRAADLGQRLGERCHARYAASKVASEFITLFKAALTAHRDADIP